MVSVAFLDPGNYSTAVSAGNAYKYNLLFSILLSNCLAIFLQSLAAKLGAVTGLDLAANCKEHFSFKLNVVLYIMTEIAIIATDLAEVVGTAIALNILFNIPLFLGVIITVIDVLIVLAAYRPKGPLLFIRVFEAFVSVLVAATVVCFGIELYQVGHDESINLSVVEVFKGFLPNEDVVDMSEREGGNGLFLSLAILGATVMPHSLYLGSGLVQARLKDFDIKHGYYIPWNSKLRNSGASLHSDFTIADTETDVETENGAENDNNLHIESNDDVTPVITPIEPIRPHQATFERADETTLQVDEDEDEDDEEENDHYRPSIHAIKSTLTYTITELVISLFTVALFVNSAILIVAGATLRSSKNSLRDDHDNDHNKGYDTDDSDDEDYENADLFTIYHLLSKHLSPTAGFVFALALLCSGQSAGVVCTLAGQMVSEGFLSWSLPPVTRRLITRGLAIAPCLLVVLFAGREGLAKTLNASQVVLSLLLPIVSAPLIWFTCDKRTMRVPIFERDGDEEVDVLYNAGEDYEHCGVSYPSSSLSSSSLLSSSSSSPASASATATAMAPSSSLPSSQKAPKRFASTQPAIRLQDLRNSHPCAGWEEDDDEDENLNHPQSHGKYDEESRRLIASTKSAQNPYLNTASTIKSRSNSVSQATADLSDSSISKKSPHVQSTAAKQVQFDEGILRVKGFKDFSNGTFTSVLAILIWAFITLLNLYLVVNMFLEA